MSMVLIIAEIERIKGLLRSISFSNKIDARGTDKKI